MMPDLAELIVGRLTLRSLHCSHGRPSRQSEWTRGQFDRTRGVPAPRGRLLRRAAALALLPLLLLNVPGGLPLRAQEQPFDANGKKITGFELKGLKTLSEETMLFYLGLEVGQTLDVERLNNNIKTLWNRGLVDDLKFEAAPAAGGVRLTITVQERPILRSIDYEGLKRLSKTDVQDKISTQHIRVHEGEPMSLGELQRVKALIEDLYREKGYRFAQARYSVQDLTGNEKKVIFSVDEGDRVRISEIHFTGNKVFGNRRLRWAMRKTKETNWITRVMKKDIYDPAKLQEDLDKVRVLYRGDGYKNVVIGDPKIEVRAEKPNAASIKDQKRRMIVDIPIEEGERWKFGQVTIEGNKIYPDKALLRSLVHKSGGWLKAKEIEEGVKRITELYHNTGYIFARVDQELVERPDHVADLVIHVNESDQFKVGRIEFKGNDRTMDKVLRREVRLFEGGLVNIAAVRNSVLKINQLGYFKLDEEDPVDIDTNSEKKEVSLVFKGKESTRTEVQFGGGWSELDGFFGQFSLNTKNFLGRGEQLGASVQAGARRDLYDLSYYIPWFLDRPQTVGIRAFDSRLNYLALSSNYLQNAKGVVLSYGRNIGLFNSASVAYTFSKRSDQLTNQLTNAIDTFKIDTSSLRPAWVYDSRDNPFEPVRGKRYTVSLEYAGGVLGGNNNFLRPDVGFSLFQPLGSYPTHMVFAINGETGLLHPTNKVPLSPLEYFFLGGENSIRGHRFRSIVVRDRNGNPVLDALGNGIGGDKFLQLNLEYHFLLGGPFRLLPFVDIANVYGPGQSINLSKLRYTTGLELRITLPIFGAPLRFIYSHNLTPLPKDEFEKFQFSIGTSF